MKNILVIAAENSAENYGAQIIDEFQKNKAPVHFFGVGGDKFLARGVDVIIHNKELAIVGIIEVLSSIAKLKRCMNTLLKTARHRKTDAAILIDYPDFNIRLAKKLKKAGIPVYYYISPTVWAWRYSRVKLLKKYVTHMFIIFPFEIPIFEKEGIPFTYTGHPLLPMIKVNESRENFRARMMPVSAGKETNEPGIMVTLLPGSRKSEVHFLLPVMLKAMELLKLEFPIKLFLLKAEGIEQKLLDGFLKKSTLDVTVIPQEQGYNLIHASDIVLTTCGTSNLEIAILGTPFTAVYRVNRLSYLLGKRFVKITLYSIVNILAQKEVIKEWIQNNFTAGNVLKEMRHILVNLVVREKMSAEFARIREMLGKDKNAPEIIYRKISTDIFGPQNTLNTLKDTE
ncbi:MAG TPA: lipid-A-disaccharide synthase [Candidatus Deferrimicrobium sp.]|nr:lipid-A-disaccharide synthase [Candidatus Deferrimicrobium sp.]